MNEKPTESTEHVSIISLISKIEEHNNRALRNCEQIAGLLFGGAHDFVAVNSHDSLLDNLTAVYHVAQHLEYLTDLINKAVGGEDEEV